VTLEEATALLSTPKERAENLMIVDLIRHDLHGVAGSGSVSVPALMVVEEYETVYQLVSVIEGRLPCPLLPEIPLQPVIEISSSHPAYGDLEDGGFPVERRHHTGIDVLAAALPPGSMTGAPKRRACRLLRDIEQDRQRSIYSGVVGYMCVTGKGDFSVVIRSAYRWDDETVVRDKGASETWYMGAGGAITDLSTEEGEWEEMLTKLRGTLRSFAPGAEAKVWG
jgi:para-aminobenzoate synthetase